MTRPDTPHVSVLLDEVQTGLAPERGGVFVDGTVGRGGHAERLLDGGADRLIGVDRDPRDLALARETLARFGDRVSLVHADYRDLPSVLDAQGVAYHAQRLGIPAVIVMPAFTPTVKVERTRGFGAEIVLTGDSF